MLAPGHVGPGLGVVKAYILLASSAWVACSADFPSSSVETRSLAVAAADAPLVVSLTFDDTWKTQLAAAAILDSGGLKGTFYVNSPRLYQGDANPVASLYMSVGDAQALQAGGHELGAHTLSHLRLTTLPAAEQAREIAGDRLQLLRLGLEVRSLAYPNGDTQINGVPAASLLEIVRAAGYSSARDTSKLQLTSCTAATESIPALDRYDVRSPRPVNNVPPVRTGQPPVPADTAATLLSWMDHASACGGGWLPITFHHVLESCSGPDAPSGYCFETAELSKLVGELAKGERCPEDGTGRHCYAVQVVPVSGVLGETELSPAPAEVFAARNASLERTLASGNTECVQHLQGSQGTATFARSTELAHTGQASERMEIIEPYLSPAEILVTRDYGACSVFATEGQSYQLSLYYRADPDSASPLLRFVVYRLTRDYAWRQWTIGRSALAQTPGKWVWRTFTTRPVPPDTLALSFGLRQESAGAVNVDDFSVLAASPAAN